MIKLLILADDYTGALDTGVQFASGSCKVKAVHGFEQYTACVDEDLDVLIYATQTRHMDPKDAYEVIHKIARLAYEKKVPCIYKKTDSALRGNVGAEIEALMEACESRRLMMVPSFPKMNRVLKDGILYIDGVPVGESVFANDPFNPVRESEIRKILGEQTNLPVISLKVGEVPSKDADDGIYAYDAATMEEMENIAGELSKEQMLYLVSGCAGFAEVLKKFLFHEEEEKEKADRFAPAMVLCGSLNKKTKEQIAYAKERGVSEYVLKIEALLEASFFESGEWKDLKEQLISKIGSGCSVILRTEEGIPEGVDVDELGSRIASRLGILGTHLIREEKIRTLYIVGGDTLHGFIEAADIREVIPMAAKNTGVVVTGIVVDGQDKHLITKSGGLGTVKAIYEICEK